MFKFQSDHALTNLFISAHLLSLILPFPPVLFQLPSYLPTPLTLQMEDIFFYLCVSFFTFKVLWFAMLLVKWYYAYKSTYFQNLVLVQSDHFKQALS